MILVAKDADVKEYLKSKKELPLQLVQAPTVDTTPISVKVAIHVTDSDNPIYFITKGNQQSTFLEIPQDKLRILPNEGLEVTLKLNALAYIYDEFKLSYDTKFDLKDMTVNLTEAGNALSFKVNIDCDTKKSHLLNAIYRSNPALFSNDGSTEHPFIRRITSEMGYSNIEYTVATSSKNSVNMLYRELVETPRLLAKHSPSKVDDPMESLLKSAEVSEFVDKGLGRLKFDQTSVLPETKVIMNKETIKIRNTRNGKPVPSHEDTGLFMNTDIDIEGWSEIMAKDFIWKYLGGVQLIRNLDTYYKNVIAKGVVTLKEGNK